MPLNSAATVIRRTWRESSGCFFQRTIANGSSVSIANSTRNMTQNVPGKFPAFVAPRTTTGIKPYSAPLAIAFE